MMKVNDTGSGNMDEALMKEKLSTVCRQFRLPGELLFYRWIPKGHINMS